LIFIVARFLAGKKETHNLASAQVVRGLRQSQVQACPALHLARCPVFMPVPPPPPPPPPPTPPPARAMRWLPQELVDGSCCAATLVDSPYYKRLTAAAIARGKHSGTFSQISCSAFKHFPSFHVGLRLDPQHFANAQLRTKEAGRPTALSSRGQIFSHRDHSVRVPCSPGLDQATWPFDSCNVPILRRRQFLGQHGCSSRSAPEFDFASE